MRSIHLTEIFRSSFICLLLVIISCCIQAGCGINYSKYERTVQVSEYLEPGSEFSAENRNGSISAMGFDVSECRVIATIIARAQTVEAAKELAEETSIELVPYGKKLSVKIIKPHILWGKSVTVNLGIIIPKQTPLNITSRGGAVYVSEINRNIKAETRNGKVTISKIKGDINTETRNGGVVISDIKGDIDAETSNGSITIRKSSGSIKAEADNGRVILQDISGDIDVSTRNGKVKAVYSKTARPICNAVIVTRNGSIDFTPPPGFSASVEVSTRNGTIQSNLPIAINGKIGKSIKGEIGSGKGRLFLETRNGSIKIK